MKPATARTFIRPFVSDDIQQVAELHRRVFETEKTSSPALLSEYKAYFEDVFLREPPVDEDLASLVYEENDTIRGFLGSVCRTMKFEGRPILARISSQFIVDPASRGSAGLSLLRTYLSGPQDLSIADEANTNARIVWEALGGRTHLLSSLHWIYPIKPMGMGLTLVGPKLDRPYYQPLIRLATPIANVLDGVIHRTGLNPYKAPPSSLVPEPLDIDVLLSSLPKLLADRVLRPDYDPDTATWLIQRLEKMEPYGHVAKVLLKTQSGDPVGWYVCHIRPKRISELVQLCAIPRFVDEVLQHAIHSVAQAGSVALRGRLEAHIAAAVANRSMALRCGPQWLLYHARDASLLRTFEQQTVFLSRLDGEWPMHFR